MVFSYVSFLYLFLLNLLNSIFRFVLVDFPESKGTHQYPFTCLPIIKCANFRQTNTSLFIRTQLWIHFETYISNASCKGTSMMIYGVFIIFIFGHFAYYSIIINLHIGLLYSCFLVMTDRFTRTSMISTEVFVHDLELTSSLNIVCHYPTISCWSTKYLLSSYDYYR